MNKPTSKKTTQPLTAEISLDDMLTSFSCSAPIFNALGDASRQAIVMPLRSMNKLYI